MISTWQWLPEEEKIVEENLNIFPNCRLAYRIRFC